MKDQRDLVTNEPVLEGESVFLEGLTDKHISHEYAEWFNDKEVCRENRHGKGDNTIKKTAEYVTSVDKAEDAAVFAIIDRDSNRHIGNISLGKISWKESSAEISIIIGEKDYWGKGRGREAYKLVINYAFNTLKLNRLYSGMTIRNKAMIKLAEKVGMSKTGVEKDAFSKGGEYIDIVKYEIMMPNQNNDKTEG